MRCVLAAALGLAMLGLVALIAPVSAQTVPRIKATVVSFIGQTLIVMPAGETSPMTIGVRPATRIMREEKKTLADIKVGDFIGATVIRAGDGSLHAQEVHVFPDALHGSGEGLYPAAPGASRSILNASVAGLETGGLSLTFRGAAGEGAQCTGRAPTTGGCDGAAHLAVAPGVPVIALQPGDKSLLTPGAVLALSVMAGPDGKPVTPGLTVETVETPPAADDPAPKASRPSARHP